MNALAAAVIAVQLAVVQDQYKAGTRPTEDELTGRWITHAGSITRDQEIEFLDAGSCASADTHQTVEFGRMQLGKLGRMLAARTEGKTSMVLMLADAAEARLPGKSKCRLVGGAEGVLLCSTDQGYKAWVKLRASCGQSRGD